MYLHARHSYIPMYTVIFLLPVTEYTILIGLLCCQIQAKTIQIQFMHAN